MVSGRSDIGDQFNSHLGGSEWSERNVGGLFCTVYKWPDDGVEIVCPDGNEGSLPANVSVELFLQVNEGIVRFLVKRHTSQHGRHCKRTDGLCLRRARSGGGEV
jgi:hypothetical protein